jgi:hypothetical protein
VRRDLLCLFIIVAMSAACTRSTPSPEAMPATIAIAPRSSWVLVHGGSSPVVRTKDGAVWIFAFSDPIGPDQHELPGIAIGDARGPNLGLLSGRFAPLVVFPDSAKRWPLTITATRTTLHVSTGTIAAAIRAPDQRRVVMTLRGAPWVALPADRTTVRGFFASAPSFELEVSAGDRPSIRAPHADAVEVDSARIGRVRIEADCDRPILLRPTPRGSTSVFLVRDGPNDGADPLFSADDVNLGNSPPCPTSATTTISVTRGR